MNQKPEPATEVLDRVLDRRLVTRGKVVIIGLGGIGLHLARAVVTFLAGIVQAADHEIDIEVLLVDGDSFAIENTYRMDVPAFGNKAEVVGRDLLERTDAPGLSIRWLGEYVTADNLPQIVANGDCVLLACDNHATRHCVGRYCADESITDMVLISGGNDGVDDGLRGTYGNVQVHVRQAGTDMTAPLEAFHPEIADPADQIPDQLDCLQLAASGALQFSFVNMAVASAMCSALLRLMMPIRGERMYDEISLDVLDAVQIPNWISGPQQANESTADG